MSITRQEVNRRLAEYRKGTREDALRLAERLEELVTEMANGEVAMYVAIDSASRISRDMRMFANELQSRPVKLEGGAA